MEFPRRSWIGFVQHSCRALAAFALALTIAWEHEVATRVMGLRTLPFAAVACCVYILVGIALVSDEPRAHGRLLGGLVAGIGIIGGGSILKGDDRVSGAAPMQASCRLACLAQPWHPICSRSRS